MTKQRHSNRLDATRKTGRFWGYLRRAFAGVLSSNPGNQNKPSKLAKLTMTNSQESDSIAEKPEVVKTEPKSNRWNWKTVIAVTLTAAVNAVSLASAIIQPVRQRLNQWNWRQKTALVTALAITAGSTFYYQRGHAAAIAWPAVIASAGSKEFLVKLFVSIGVSRAVNSALDKKIKKTAYAQTDGWRYRNREYLKRTYYYGERATRNGGQNGHSVDAQAMANQLKAYDTSGTDSSLDPTTLYPDEVLDDVSDNANLTGRTDGFKIPVEDGHGGWEQLYTDSNKYHNARQARGYTKTWGGYVKEPTEAEIQADLDQMREEWNEQRTRRPWQRPYYMGRLKLGERTRYKREQFTCDKKIKLWSEFGFTRVPGDTTAGPSELQQPGNRPNYVTSFSYYAREAGYNHSIVTKVPQNEEPQIDYPEPKSWEDHDFMGFDLTKIPWENFQIIGTPVWTGDATRHFKHRKSRVCTRHTRCYAGIGQTTLPPFFSFCRTTTKREYPVYQEESVVKP